MHVFPPFLTVFITILRKLHTGINEDEDVVRILDCYVGNNVENGLNFKYFK